MQLQVRLAEPSKNLFDSEPTSNAVASSVVVQTFPLVQPTHTSYLTFATLSGA